MLRQAGRVCRATTTPTPTTTKTTSTSTTVTPATTTHATFIRQRLRPPWPAFSQLGPPLRPPPSRAFHTSPANTAAAATAAAAPVTPSSKDKNKKYRVRPEIYLGRGQLQLPLIADKEKWFSVAKKSWAWQRRFTPIWKRLERGSTEPPPLRRDIGLVRLEKLLALDTVQDMKSHWFARPELKRELDFGYVMLAAMNFHPETVPQVLEAILEPRVTPYWAVADIFAFLVKRASILPDHLQKKHQAAIPPLLLHVLRNSSPGDFRLQQWVLGHIMSTSDADTAAEMYSALRQYKHPLHFNTKFKIAERLMTDEKYRMLVLQILEDLVIDDGMDIGDRRCAALATALITLPAGWKEGRCSPVEVEAVVKVFERILALGHSPNLITYTAMIRTLCLTNQLDTALGIYKIMREQGMAPDSHVFAILLDGARRAASLESAIQILKKATRANVRSPLIASNILFTVFTAGRQEARDTSQFINSIPIFTPMLRVFDKFYKLESLQTLLPVDLRARIQTGAPEDKVLESCNFGKAASRLIDRLPWIPERRKLDPPLGALGIMLVGYMRSSPNWRLLQDFYLHFRRLLNKLDPVAVAVANHSTLPYDALIKALTHNFRITHQALSIVDEMVANAGKTKQPTGWTPRPDAPDPYAPVDEQPPAPETPQLNPPPPSVYTWTILIGAMLHRKVHHKARQTLFNMYEQGAEPNLVTFNTFIADYARHQGWRRVVDFANRLENAGYYPNQRTLTSMARLHDPGPVLDWAERRAELRATERWRELDRAVALSGLAIPEEEAPKKQRWQVEEEENAKAATAAAAAKKQAARQQTLEDDGKMRQPDESARAVADPAVAAATAVQGRKKMLQTAQIGAYMEMYDELFFGQPAVPVADVQAEVSQYGSLFDDLDEDFQGEPGVDGGKGPAGGASPPAETDPFAHLVEQRENYQRVGRETFPDPFLPSGEGEAVRRVGLKVSPTDPFVPVGEQEAFRRAGQDVSEVKYYIPARKRETAEQAEPWDLSDPFARLVEQRETFNRVGGKASPDPFAKLRERERAERAGSGAPPDPFTQIAEQREPLEPAGKAASPGPFALVGEPKEVPTRARQSVSLLGPFAPARRPEEPFGRTGRDQDWDKTPVAEEAPETEEPVPPRARGGE